MRGVKGHGLGRCLKISMFVEYYNISDINISTQITSDDFHCIESTINLNLFSVETIEHRNVRERCSQCKLKLLVTRL